MTKYILGGGLSGLVAAYYNPEYTVITPDFGGFIDSKFGRAFVVLHATDPMRELFDELGIKSFEKRVEIAYYDHGSGLWTELEAEQERHFAREYVEEKLPDRMQPGKDLELSAPGDSWQALFVDESIVDALKSEVRNFKFGHIEEIRDGEMTLVPTSSERKELEWDEIISTLPAPLFRKIADTDWSLDHHPTTYAEIPRHKIPERYFSQPWNILYTVDPGVEYHRVVRNMLSSRYFVECLGDVDVYGATDQFTNDHGVIADEELDAPYPGITFLGRYAEWQHDVRIDHVVERAQAGL